MSTFLSGIVVPLVTPLKEGKVDLKAFSLHLERQIEAGVDGLFCLWNRRLRRLGKGERL
jgi:dihydrodipicolinate synthase/N-acetylneuraminate lyase